MIDQEAKIICRMLRELKGKTILNIGSSSEEFYKKEHPFIWNLLMRPLIKNNNKFVNMDLKKEKGVDVVGDFEEGIKVEYDIILFCNCIEHVKGSLVNVINNLYSALKDDGILIISAPGVYPYHEDPIDNNFRFPTLKRWLSLLEFCEDKFKVIEYCQTKEQKAPVRYCFEQLTFSTIIKCVKNKKHMLRMSNQELFETRYLLKKIAEEEKKSYITKVKDKMLKEIKLKLEVDGIYLVKLMLKDKTKVVKKKDEVANYYLKLLAIIRQAGQLYKEELKR